MPTFSLQDWIAVYSRNRGMSNPAAVAQAVVQSAAGAVAFPSQYGVAALLPFVHALASNWKGSDSCNALYQAAARFGLAALDPLAAIQVDGLDDAYLEFLRTALGSGESGVRRAFLQRMGWAMWMANMAIRDLLTTHLSYAASYTLPDLRTAKAKEVAGSHYASVLRVIRNAAALVEQPLAVNPRLQYLEEYELSKIIEEAKFIQRKFGPLATQE